VELLVCPARNLQRGENAVKKTRVIILFGGRSAEHEISILSARNVLGALDRQRFEPVLIGIDRAGRWHRESERTLAAATGDPRALALDPAAPTVSIEQGLVTGSLDDAATDDLVVFPVLHGTFGEDGTVQGLLELGDVPYVGAGVLGSAIGMDKDVAKRLLRDAGIPVVDFTVVTSAAFARDPAAALSGAARLGWPLFVKPVNAGSSVGVSRVNGPDGLAPAVRAALAFDRKVLIERAVDAREIECAVLGNDEPVASVPGEILVHHKDGFYSYDAKYVDPSGASWKIPADLPPATTAHVQTLAVETFRTLELAGLARIDFFLSRADGALYVNEVNTLPGFTAVSMYPKMWEASGLSQTDLLTRLVELALQRWKARRTIHTGRDALPRP
jgi:D-alanine-D-alanine ligase